MPLSEKWLERLTPSRLLQFCQILWLRTARGRRIKTNRIRRQQAFRLKAGWKRRDDARR